MANTENLAPVGIFNAKNLLTTDLQNRDPKNRFSIEEQISLAQNLREAWGVSLDRQNRIPPIGFNSVVEAGNYKDTEPYVLKNPNLPMTDQLDVIFNLQTREDVDNLRAVLDELGNPYTTLATMYFPLQRGDRPETRPGGEIETMLLRRLIRDLSVNNIRRLIVSGSHSPAFSYFALEAGIAVVDVIPLPAMFDAAVEQGLFKDKTIIPVTSDDGASNMGKAVEELAKEAGVAFEPTVCGKKTKTFNKTEVSFSNEQLDRVKGKTAVIAEDILATGGTLDSTVTKLLSAGVEEVVILVTYPIFAGEALKLLGNREKVTIITTDGRTPLTNINTATNITQIPILERFSLIMDLDRQGIDYWSKEGKKILRNLGFCLNPWMDVQNSCG